MNNAIENHVHLVRKQRGLTAAELARQVGVSRQTIYAIESGAFVPNTEVSLRLAGALSSTVEQLFSLRGAPRSLDASIDVVSSQPVGPGSAVRLCEIGGKLIAVPAAATPAYLPEADGVLTGTSGVTMFEEAISTKTDLESRIAIAGCDPAIGILASVARRHGVEILGVAASSKLALEWLNEGRVHIAGCHLRDPRSGEFNLPYLRRQYGKANLAVVSYATWEQGFVVRPGNPKGIRRVEDLLKRGIRFVNREEGSGSRALLDRLLEASGIDKEKVNGYSRAAAGHLATAYLVHAGDADCCIATGSAARAFQLDFVPLQTERYDFVLRRETLGTAVAGRFFDVLQQAAARRRLEGQAGYDTHVTGNVLM